MKEPKTTEQLQSHLKKFKESYLKLFGESVDEAHLLWVIDEMLLKQQEIQMRSAFDSFSGEELQRLLRLNLPAPKIKLASVAKVADIRKKTKVDGRQIPDPTVKI